MANYKLNFSCEDFVPSRKCIFIKRISDVEDETFLYNLEFYLAKYKFDGVCYVGEEVGEVLEEFFSQELWEKAVMMQTRVIGFYLVGNVNVQTPLFKDRYLFVQNCKTYRIETKKVTFNPTPAPNGSEKSLRALESLVRKLVSDANEEAGE